MDTNGLDLYVRALRVLTKDHFDLKKYKHSYSKLKESEKMLAKTKSDLGKTISENSLSNEKLTLFHRKLARISRSAIEAKKNTLQFIFQDLSEYLATKFYSDIKDMDHSALRDFQMTLAALKNQVETDLLSQELGHMKEHAGQIITFIKTYQD